jgi:hypothetical protein
MYTRKEREKARMYGRKDEINYREDLNKEYKKKNKKTKHGIQRKKMEVKKKYKAGRNNIN